MATVPHSQSVYLVTTIFPPAVGGPATYVHSLAMALSVRGWRVAVLTYEKNPLPCIFSVRSVPLFLPMRIIALLYALITQGRKYDVWYAHGGLSVTLPTIVVAYAVGKRCGIKITGDYAWETARNRQWTDSHIDDFQKMNHGFLIAFFVFLRAWVARHASFVIVPSHYLGRMVAGWGVPEKNITVIYNAVSRPISPVTRTRDSRLIFSAGRFVPWKGFYGLLRAFSNLPTSCKAVHLVIAGSGPEDVLLRKYSKTLGISGRVDFIGNISSEEMLVWYARAGCVALFSEYEGMSHILLEALVCGAPIVASDAGGNAELAISGGNILIVPSGDEKALAHALTSVLRQPSDGMPPFRIVPNAYFSFCSLVDRTAAILGSHSKE